MNPELIAEGNRKIAKYCGAVPKPSIHPDVYQYPDSGIKPPAWGNGLRMLPDSLVALSEMKYYSSYDWIIPVVHSIQKIIYDKFPDPVDWVKFDHQARIALSIYTIHLSNSVESVWWSALTFIEWYEKECPATLGTYRLK